MKIKDLIWVSSSVISPTESVDCVSGVWKEMGRGFRALEKRERCASGVSGLLRFSHLPERCKSNDLVPLLMIPYFDWLKSTTRYMGLLTFDKSAWNFFLSWPFYRSLNSFHKLGTLRCKFPILVEGECSLNGASLAPWIDVLLIKKSALIKRLLNKKVACSRLSDSREVY